MSLLTSRYYASLLIPPLMGGLSPNMFQSWLALTVVSFVITFHVITIAVMVVLYMLARVLYRYDVFGFDIFLAIIKHPSRFD